MDNSLPLLLVGILVLFGGLIAAYTDPYQPIYYGIAFFGIIITLIGMAFFSGSKKE